MYADPSLIRENRMTIRLNDKEHGLIIALANYLDKQPATLLREMVMQEATQIIADPSNITQQSA